MTYYNKLEFFLFWSAYYNLGSVNTKIAPGHFKGKVSPLMTQRMHDRGNYPDSVSLEEHEKELLKGENFGHPWPHDSTFFKF